MEATEITKVIDGVYKNILENFNPSSRQMISTGKAYLKSLHGASAASSLYLDTLTRLSRQAQASTLGNSGDIGTSLIQITEVFKEIHAQQLNTLKAFYVDFLVPLENNLEKDTRVIQTEQKKFLMCHKQRMESYNKAASTVKKIRKKSRKSNASAAALDKEIKVMQNLEEERSKLEAFCDKSIKDALTQERRRYGFILERQASLAKHYLAFYGKGNSLLNAKLENWMKVAKSRETLPESMQNALLKRIQGGDEEECIYCSPRRPGACDDTCSISSQLRKTKSMDAGEIINLQSEQSELTVASGAGTMSRAKSELNLMMNGGGGGGTGGGGGGTGGGNASSQNNPGSTGFSHDTHDGAREAGISGRPKSLAVATETTNSGYAKALYAYLSSGENQLSFLEGDMISLIGDRNKGWQFGENLRTQKTGWFPVAYTEMDVSSNHHSIMDSTMSKSANNTMTPTMTTGTSPVPPPMSVPLPPSVLNMNHINSQQNMTSRMTMTGGAGGGQQQQQQQTTGHGPYSPTTSSSNSSSSTFHHQKRLNADVIVHRTPESSMMMMNPTTPTSANNKSIVTSPLTPMGGPPNNNNLIGGPPSSRTVAATAGVVTSSGRHGGHGHGHGHGPSAACTSDSLHSSNDSGISNDLNTGNVAGGGGGGGIRGGVQQPPPQPDVDYSDDDVAHLTNRQKEIVCDRSPPAQSGDKWLMERYVTSESIRIGGLGIAGITRRRSLSFSNVSGVGVGSQMRTGGSRGGNPNDFLNSGYSPYPGRHLINGGNGGGRRLLSNDPTSSMHRSNRHNHHRTASFDHGGPLKKFLNRTKSLIWKRTALDPIDSISAAGSHHGGSMELWGSHISLIDANYDFDNNTFEMKELCCSSSKQQQESSRNHYDDDDTIKNENVQGDDDDDLMNTNSGHNNETVNLRAGQKSAGIKNSKHNSSSTAAASGNGGLNTAKAVPPPLPPFPANLRGLNGMTKQNQNNKATSTTESLHNQSMSNSPLPPSLMDSDVRGGGCGDGGSTIGPRDNDSCIFISDHMMKQKGSTRSGGTRKSTKSSVSHNGNDLRLSKKIQTTSFIMADDDYGQHEVSSASAKKGQVVSRIESFSEYEAPIVPIKSSKKKGSAVAAVSNQHQHHNGQNGHINSNSNGNDNGMSSSNRKKFKNKRNVTKMGLVATDNHNNINGRGPLSRSHIMAAAEEKSRKFSYNTDDDDEEDVDDVTDNVDEYDVDEDVLDFDDEEDPYAVNENDLDNTSSIFMEGETEDLEEEVQQEQRQPPARRHGNANDSQPQSLPPIPTQNGGSHNKNQQTNSNPRSNRNQQQSNSRPMPVNGKESSSREKNNNNNIENGHGGGGASKGKSSAKSSSSMNGHNFNGDGGHYNHSSRFAPIDAYGDSNSNHVNGNGIHHHQHQHQPQQQAMVNGKGGGNHRMNSPAPPPPPTTTAVALKSNGHHHGSNGGSSSHRHQNNGHHHSGGEKGRTANGNSGRKNQHHANNSRPTTIKGSIRSEFHTVELIATTAGETGSSSKRSEKPIFDYGSHIHKRLYFPERNSRLDQKSETSNNRYGPWYDLWEADPSVPCK